MKSKLHRELQEFLGQEKISIDSGIVNYITYQLAGIKASEEQLREGFSFENEETFDKENINFSIASKLNYEQIKNLLLFFNISSEKYLYGSPIVLNDRYIFGYFIIEFKKHFQSMKEDCPEIFAKYKAISASILETKAKNTLAKCIDDAKKIILFAHPTVQLTHTIKSLIDFISRISGHMQALDVFPHFYEDILNSTDEIKKFLQLSEIKEHAELAAQLNMILKGINLFASYQRDESILKNVMIHNEFKAFLIPYRITPSKCDLLGHVILFLTEARMLSKSYCCLSAGEDASRLVITFGDINQENTNIIINYMRQLGDDTAIEGDGRKYIGTTSNPNLVSPVVKYPMNTRDNGITVKQYETRNIEVDGKFFYTSVFPKIKDRVSKMAEQCQLSSYQELSKEDFKHSRETAKVSGFSIFEKLFNSPEEMNTSNNKSSRTCICSALGN
jgi:hypothetical protein